jgi:hypothetical protein
LTVFEPDSLCQMVLVLLCECFDADESATSFGGEVQSVRTSIGFGPATLYELPRLECVQ